MFFYFMWSWKMNSLTPNWDELLSKVKAIIADWECAYKNAKTEEEKIKLGKGLMKAYYALAKWEKDAHASLNFLKLKHDFFSVKSCNFLTSTMRAGNSIRPTDIFKNRSCLVFR